MTLAQFLSILRAHKWAALLVFALTVGSALGVSLMLPKTYTATASVVIDVKPDPLGGAMVAHMLSPAYMATQVDVMSSDRVARRVVRNLKLTEQPAVRTQWQEATKGEGDIEQWLVSAFETRLDVKPSRESNVVSLSFKSNDPRFSATMANAYVLAYMETSNELRVDPARQYSSFFDQRAKEARDQLEKAQAASWPVTSGWTSRPRGSTNCPRSSCCCKACRPSRAAARCRPWAHLPTGCRRCSTTRWWQA
jgi:polysaccharide biosynthesis transport protein